MATGASLAGSKAVLVLGMHRSGTSSVAGLLALAGLPLGERLIAGNDFNPKGYFEHEVIWRLDHELLEALGSSWYDVRRLPERWPQSEAAAGIRKKLAQVLDRDFIGHAYWGIKDPRMCRLMPLWRDLLGTLEVEPKVILVLRHPFAVAASLMRRDGLKADHALALWLRYLLEAEAASRNLPRVALSYAATLGDWRSAMAGVRGKLALPLRVEAEYAAAADAFIDPALCHHRQEAFPTTDGEIQRLVLTAWEALTSLGEMTASKTLDAVADQFDALADTAAVHVQQAGYTIAEARELRQARDYLEGELVRVRDDLEGELVRVRDDLEGELARERVELSERQVELGRARDHSEELATKLEEASANQHELSRELEQIKRSHSWRVTRPLREVATLWYGWRTRSAGLRVIPTAPAAAELPPAAGKPEAEGDPGDNGKPLSSVPEDDVPTRPRRPVADGPRILLASPDWMGPIRNGGIGTAFTALARHLAMSGWRVTALYTLGGHSEAGDIRKWVERYREWGIDLIALPKWKGPPLDAPWYRSRSYRIYHWLVCREADFDAVIWPEWQGEAYYSLWARRTGLHFHSLPMTVVTHSPTAWAQGGNYWLPDSPDQVDLHEMESLCVALADFVVSPSAYLIEWMMQHGWRLPPVGRRRVLRNLMLPEATTPVPETRGGDQDGRIREWVFFGRLEPRKGLEVFCRALDRLSQEDWEPMERVTFLGKGVETAAFSSDAFLKALNGRWPRPFQVIDDLDSEAARTYLRGSGRLAVIASLVENSPYTVLECLSDRIRFLAADVGGIAELIDERDRESVLFPPRPAALAEKLRDPASRLSPARAAVTDQAACSAWDDFMAEWVASGARETTETTKTSAAPPRVSVCLVHYERPHLLAQAVASLRAQTYGNFEVILVDDGSRSRKTEDYLSALDQDFARRGWRIIRQENRYLGAARNAAARHATGEYLLFMDDDNVAKPKEIECFVRAAVKTEADIVTCPSSVFTGELPPCDDSEPDCLWLPLGSALGVGLIRNGFGDANALVKRQLFERVGGFTEDYGIGHEDWEFFVRAALRGACFAFVPDPLFYYRLSSSGMLRSGDSRRDHYRSFRPYLESFPPGLGAAMGYGLHLHLEADRRWRETSATTVVPRAARGAFKGLTLLSKNRTLRLKFRQALREYGWVGAIRKGALYLGHKN